MSARARGRRTGHRDASLWRPTDTSRRVAVRVFAAPQDPSDRRHRVQFPARLGEDPGTDERGDEDGEPNANHGQHGITAQPERNRVFPSKNDAFPSKNIRPPLQTPDLRENHQPVRPGHVSAKLSAATATGMGEAMVNAGPAC
jgi:hypothetical protein